MRYQQVRLYLYTGIILLLLTSTGKVNFGVRMEWARPAPSIIHLRPWGPLTLIEAELGRKSEEE